MTPELNEARSNLIFAQQVLAKWRAANVSPNLLRYAEQRVGVALDWVWLEQCRAVFEDHDDDFFETDLCRRFVNNVDWGASYDTGASVPSCVVHLKSPMPGLTP